MKTGTHTQVPMTMKWQAHGDNPEESRAPCQFKKATRFCPLRQLCRIYNALSQQLGEDFALIFGIWQKSLYLCIVNQTKQVLGDANKRINKIIISKN